MFLEKKLHVVYTKILRKNWKQYTHLSILSIKQFWVDLGAIPKYAYLPITIKKSIF